MSTHLNVQQIVSGGQTGVDQAALQVALDLNLAHGGWCPKGRRCEAGRIPERFLLTESHSREYAVRTEQNVLDSDGTLILFHARLSGGTRLTRRLAEKHQRAWLSVDLQQTLAGADAFQRAVQRVRQWLRSSGVRRLNVAGPRESGTPGIYGDAYRFLWGVFHQPPPTVQ